MGGSRDDFGCSGVASAVSGSHINPAMVDDGDGAGSPAMANDSVGRTHCQKRAAMVLKPKTLVINLRALPHGSYRRHHVVHPTKTRLFRVELARVRFSLSVCRLSARMQHAVRVCQLCAS